MAIGLSVGQSIRSKGNEWYKCVQHLGTGGNAVTFLVFSTSGRNNGCLFALKIFQRVSDEDRLRKFHREIEFLEGCSHPAIMRVYDSGAFSSQGQSHPFVIMEYLPAHLHTEMRRGTLDMTAKVSLATQLMSALAYLDEQTPKIVHRDIKPQNIFVKGKTCVLGDFGLMKVYAEGVTEAEEDRADMAAYIGMPFYYRTPDLVAYTRGEASITTASDVFQLGLVLAELFSGRNPCRVPNQKLDPVVLDPIAHIPGELGTRVFHLIGRMLENEPSERPTVSSLLDHWNGVFESAVEMAHALNGRAM